MGLACSQIRLLTLTTRKADCELGISLDSIQKWLSQESNHLFPLNITASYRQKSLLLC